MSLQVEMREAQRVHGVDEEIRPPRPDELIERQHRGRATVTVRTVKRVAMRTRGSGPCGKRHRTQFIAIEQQLFRQRLEAVLRQESPEQLEILGRPQVLAVPTQVLEAFGANHRDAVSDAHLASRKPPCHRLVIEGEEDARGAVGGQHSQLCRDDADFRVRIEDGHCAVEHDRGPTLNAVGLGAHGRPLAVGDEGMSLERNDAGAWEESDLDVGRASLRGIERIGRYVYVVGTGGALLRRIVVDGT